MTVTESGLDDLRKAMTGDVLTPGEPAYDTSRSLFNGLVDKRPGAVALVSTTADVAAAVRFARDRGLDLSVRGGGHGYSGACIAEGGLMIDLARLNTVTVDPTARRARVGGGARLGDMDAGTQEHGLATTSGMISNTGVGGLTLGGGMGWLTHSAGLAIDNMISAEVVLADGSVVRASAAEHPDLFWALRGGGGNFGAVTEFEFALHPVGPIVHMHLLFWEIERSAEALRLIRDTMGTLPRTLAVQSVAGLNAPPLPFVPEEHHFRLGVALVVTGLGAPEEHAALVGELRAALPPLWEFGTPMPYAALQQMFNESAPWGIKAYSKSLLLPALSDGAVDVLAEWLPRKVSPMSLVPLFPLTGAYGEVADDATAWAGGRSARISIGFDAIGPEADLVAADTAWVRGFYAALLPYAEGPGGYLNFAVDVDTDLVRTAYGSKYARLASIKAAYDPDNAFRPNTNILPAAG